MSLAHGPDLIAIPGPSPVPARVLNAAQNAQEAVQWTYMAYLASVKSQGAMSGRPQGP